MGEGEIGEESVERTGMHEKNSHKTQQIWHLGMSLGATALCHTCLDSLPLS